MNQLFYLWILMNYFPVLGLALRRSVSENTSLSLNILVTRKCIPYGNAGCKQCLDMNRGNQTQFYSYCTNPDFCFYVDNSTNSQACLRICDGGTIDAHNASECSSAKPSISVVIITIVTLGFCPLMVVFGCCFVGLRKLRRMYGNKGGVHPEEPVVAEAELVQQRAYPVGSVVPVGESSYFSYPPVVEVQSAVCQDQHHQRHPEAAGIYTAVALYQ